jgi:NAD(P)H-flavin reductase
LSAPDQVRVTAARIAPETPSLVTLRLSLAGTSLAETYRIPGQHLKLSVPGQSESAFAIASAPSADDHFDFLIRRGSPAADALAALRPGDAVLARRVTGKGFDLASARGHDLLLVAAGSGISAIRSVVETVRDDREAFGRVCLVHGVRSASQFVYAAEHRDWRDDRIEIIPVVSQPSTEWSGKSGHVQQHLPEDLDRSRTFALLCGPKEMIRDVTAELIARGVPRERILLNT